MYKTTKKDVTNTKAITAMGSREASVIKLNNEENPAEEGVDYDDKDDERIQDNEGSGAVDGAWIWNRRYLRRIW